MERNYNLEKAILIEGFRQGVRINFENPVTIQDKLNFLKANDNTWLKTLCADKARLSEYCEDVLGVNLCIPKMFVYKSTEEIEWNKLPQKFVIKCNHGSTMNIIVKDKNTCDKDNIYDQLNKWLKIDYSSYWHEMYYGDIPRRIIVEEYIEGNMHDTKCWCFNGEFKFCSREEPLANNHPINHYDKDYNLLTYSFSHQQANMEYNYEKPCNFEKMKEYATLLSSNFKFCRVDFFENKGKLYLGEITFIPWAGYFHFTRTEDEIEVGNMLQIENRYRKICYTSLIGNYDEIKDPTVITEGWDYICITDKPFKSNVWRCLPLPSDVLEENIDDTKKQRKIKILSHRYLPQHEISIYMDSHILIRTNLDDFIREKCKDSLFSAVGHPWRNCIYEEIEEVKRLNIENYELCDKLRRFYEKEGFPAGYGLTENNLLVRYNNAIVQDIMKQWWDEVKTKSKRDQLSLMYILWKNNFNINKLNPILTRGGEQSLFMVCGHK